MHYDNLPHPAPWWVPQELILFLIASQRLKPKTAAIDRSHRPDPRCVVLAAILASIYGILCPIYVVSMLHPRSL